MSVENPLVSVILPVFNEEDYVSIALESLLKQTYSNLEIVVVDDGSSDKTVEIVSKYAKKDERVKLFKKVKEYSDNIMVEKSSYARRFGIRMSKGSFIINFSGHAFAERNLVEVLLREVKMLRERDNKVVSVGCRYDTYCNKDILTKFLHELWGLGKRFPKHDSYSHTSTFSIQTRELFEEIGYPRADIELNILINNLGYKNYFTTKTRVYYCCKRAGVTLFLRHNLLYGNARSRYLLEYRDTKSFQKYLLFSLLSFITGYGAGFFLGLSGLDVRRFGM